MAKTNANRIVLGARSNNHNHLLSPAKHTQPPCPLESAEAKKLTSFLYIKGLTFLHIPNERKATARQIAELKKQGLQKGACDYLVFLPGKVLAIELKRQDKSKSKLSTEQKLFLEKLAKFGYVKAAVCYGADEAINLINSEIE